MVVQKTLNNLKEGPREDKVAVASGVAISVVVILLVAWAIFFFRNIQKGSQQLDLSSGAQDEFNFSGIKEAQRQLQEQYSNSTQELEQLRNEAVSQQMQFQQQTTVQETQGGGADQFSPPGSTY